MSGAGTARPSPVADAAQGVGDLLRGFRVWGSSPRLMLLGAIPAGIVGAVFSALLVALVLALPALVSGLTPFADPWAVGLRDGLRLVLDAAILLLAVVLLVLAFTAVTLTVGDPFYERIARAVEERLGDPPPDRDEPILAGMRRATADGLRLFLGGLVVAVAAFLLGLIPVAGPVLAAVFAALAGGRLLAVELTGYPYEARGLRLRDRRRSLRSRRARTLGFGVSTYLLFLIPFVAVVAMPAAVAGATMLARAVLADAPRERVAGRA